MVKLLLEPLAIFILLSGWRSRPIHGGLKLREEEQTRSSTNGSRHPGAGSWCPPPPGTGLTPLPLPLQLLLTALRQVPQASALCSWPLGLPDIGSSRCLWPPPRPHPRGGFLGRSSKRGQMELDHQQEPNLPESSLCPSSAWRRRRLWFHRLREPLRVAARVREGGEEKLRRRPPLNSFLGFFRSL